MLLLAQAPWLDAGSRGCRGASQPRSLEAAWNGLKEGILNSGLGAPSAGGEALTRDLDVRPEAVAG